MTVLKFDPKRADTLDLNSLKEGMSTGISRAVGAFFAEAASVCLEEQDHRPGVHMRVDGDCAHRVKVLWTDLDHPEQQRRAWNDEQVATEYGAYGVAALLVDKLSDYTVVERSYKGTGFDFWLGRKDAAPVLFQGTARLEVSGVRKGSEKVVASRTRQKTDQMKPTDGTLPGVAVVVEFGSPRTRVKAK